MLGGAEYRADDPELVVDRDRAQSLLVRFNAAGGRGTAARRALLEPLLGALGEGAEIVPPLHVDYGTQLRVGARTFINTGLIALDCAPITVGDDVQIGPAVQLLAATHPTDAARRREGWESASPITIGDGAWLGGGVIVGPGVTIGENAIIGAGSVVLADVPAGATAVGSPARVVKRA